MVNMLYIGLDDGTSLDRANAYRRLGHTVTHLNTRKLLPHGQWVDQITWQLGDHWLAEPLRIRLAHWLANKRFDYCHVDASEWLSPRSVRLLKRHCEKVVNYNIDDPTGPRDRKRFVCYRRAVSEYDLLCVVRTVNVAEVKSLGARNVIRVWRAADEITHAPQEITEADRAAWASDVQFIGTWMPERGKFLLELIRRGVPITIRGARWHKAPEWKLLKAFHRSGELRGPDYGKAIQCAKINLGLLSKGNRDLHTTRSMEIPSVGGVLCAERTTEHLELYREGEEALFWTDTSEAADVCVRALQNPNLLQKVAEQGRLRAVLNKNYNETSLQKILNHIM